MDTALRALLRQWRSTRRISQHELALTAAISARHLSFIETGRSQPSREVLMSLSRALELPPRERNTLLQAAGYASIYRATDLADPAMAEMRFALKLMLVRQEPFGAVVFDRRWEILCVNEAARRFLALVGETKALIPYEVTSPPRPSWLRTLLGPGEIRQRILNWREMAIAVRERVERDAVSAADRDLLRGQIDSFPDLPERQGPVGVGVLIPIRLRLGEHEVQLFSTMSSLGTAQDITLQELRIDSFHPYDAAAERAFMRRPA
jgi:transcriptional regulator with XRE-family HTH domain